MRRSNMSINVTHKINDGKDKSNETKLDHLEHLSDKSLMEIEAFDTEYILKLTRAALIAGSIPSDDSIVPFIGDGFETDNEKAVETWIRNHINMLVEIAPKNQIEKIIEEIDNRLQEVKTGYLSCK